MQKPEEVEEREERPKLPTHLGCGGELTVDEDLDSHCLKCGRRLEPWEVGDQGATMPKCHGNYPETPVECTDDCPYKTDCRVFTAAKVNHSEDLEMDAAERASLKGVEFEPKAEGQVTLSGETPKYSIDHEVSTTVTHKFASAIAKLSVSEKALVDWEEKEHGDTTVLGLVKTKIKVGPSVEGKQWEALCEEFAEAVEEHMG